jgi:hypothetical protein
MDQSVGTSQPVIPMGYQQIRVLDDRKNHGLTENWVYTGFNAPAFCSAYATFAGKHLPH